MTAVATHIPVSQLAQAARRRAEADRRRTEALARLAARRMPLPGHAPMTNPQMHLVSQPLVSVTDAPAPQTEAAPELPRPRLTNREIEVLRTWLMLDSKPAVAEELFISLGTVNTHLTRIRAKYAEMGRTASTKAALVARAVQDGLVRLDEL